MQGLPTISGPASGAIATPRVTGPTITTAQLNVQNPLPGQLGGIGLRSIRNATTALVQLGTQLTIPDNASTILSLNSVQFDTARAWDANNFWYLVPRTGYYWVGWSVVATFPNSTANVIGVLQGAAYREQPNPQLLDLFRQSFVYPSVVASPIYQGEKSVGMHLSKGDAISLRAIIANAGGNVTIPVSTFTQFSIFLISEVT